MDRKDIKSVKSVIKYILINYHDGINGSLVSATREVETLEEVEKLHKEINDRYEKMNKNGDIKTYGVISMNLNVTDVYISGYNDGVLDSLKLVNSLGFKNEGGLNVR